MANSGSFTTTGYSDPGYPDRYIFSWNLSSQSIVNNTSTITWSLVGAGGASSGYYTGVKEKYVTVNGSTQSNSNLQNTYNGTVAFSGTTTIKHNADGSGSFSASAGGAFYYYGSYNSTGSGTWSLPNIARATTPTLSATSVTMGNSVTITLTPASSTFKHKLRFAFGGNSNATAGLSIGEGFSASGNTTVTFTPAKVLAMLIPNANSGVCTLTCYTYDANGTQIGSATNTTLTLNVPSYTPTATIALTGSGLLGGVYCQSKSKVTVKTTASSSHGATITGVSATINGESDGKTYTSLEFVSAILAKSGDHSVTVKITDSRGKTATVTSSVFTVYAYSLPSITSFTLARQSDGTTVIATVKGSVASVNSKNAKSCKVTLNGVTNTITLSSYTINNTTTFTSVPTDSTLTATATITDSYNTVTKQAVLPTVAVTMDFYKDGTGIAMGKVAESSNLFEVAWKSKLNKAAEIKDNNLATLTLKRNHTYNGAAVKFQNDTDVLGYVGMYGNGADRPLRRWTSDTSASYIVLDEGNTADYVVEQGTSGSWAYRKWNSGIAECWRVISTTTGTFTGTTTGVYYATPGTQFNYPSGLFTDVTDVQMTITSAGGGVLTVFNRSGVETSYCEPAYIRLYGGTTSLSVSIGTRITGKWK